MLRVCLVPEKRSIAWNSVGNFWVKECSLNAISQFALELPSMEDKLGSLEESHYESLKFCAIKVRVGSHKICNVSYL